MSEMPHRSCRRRSRAAAAYINMSEGWLAKRRMAGLPPAYLKVGKIVLYEQDELDRFLATCRRQSTSEPDHVQQKRAAAPPAARSSEGGHD